VVDRASYEGLCRSDEMQSLASVAEKTVDPSRGGWKAFYVMGRQTVIQILAAGSNPGGREWRVGQSGIGLGYSGAENLAPIERRLRLVFGEKVKSQGGTATFPGLDIDSDESGFLSTWFMEIIPGYFVARYPLAQLQNRVSHQQYFASSFRPDRLLDDVVGVTLALDLPEGAALIEELKVAGWLMKKDEGKTVMTGPDSAITIVPAKSRFGLREVQLRLRQPAPPKEVPLGSVELSLKGDSGRMSFSGPG
jgi:hypothetical protein